MRMLRRGLILALGAGIAPPAAPQPASSDGRERSVAAAPRTDHALGVYDAQLRRVLLIGATGDPD